MDVSRHVGGELSGVCANRQETHLHIMIRRCVVWCHACRSAAPNCSRNDSPWLRNFSSSFFVQSQSQQAHGSFPFSCRQLRRECASFTLKSSKYSSQYGRSSANGGSQKHVSTQVAAPALLTRASLIL